MTKNPVNPLKDMDAKNKTTSTSTSTVPCNNPTLSSSTTCANCSCCGVIERENTKFTSLVWELNEFIHIQQLSDKNCIVECIKDSNYTISIFTTSSWKLLVNDHEHVCADQLTPYLHPIELKVKAKDVINIVAKSLRPVGQQLLYPAVIIFKKN
jgi:hypothetical protein